MSQKRVFVSILRLIVCRDVFVCGKKSQNRQVFFISVKISP